MYSKAWAADIRSKFSDNVTLQDPRQYGADFSIKEDHGTAHLALVAENGDAVSITSTINL